VSQRELDDLARVDGPLREGAGEEHLEIDHAVLRVGKMQANSSRSDRARRRRSQSRAALGLVRLQRSYLARYSSTKSAAATIAFASSDSRAARS
jgi:hypothetical protein